MEWLTKLKHFELTKREYILRYLAIIKKLRASGTATFDEVDRFLKQQSDFLGYNLKVSKRTFQRDLEEIQSIFNLDIQYDFSKKVYAIVDVPEAHDLNSRMLEAFDLFNSLNMASDLTGIVQVEQRKQQGAEHFYGLLHAIKNRFTIEFSHQKFWEEEITKRRMEPYFLKEFKNRWYLVGKDLKDNRLKSFGLERISSFDVTRRKFILPSDFKIDEIYKYSFGIIQGENEKPERIILSFTAEQGKYIKSLPIHTSQRTITDNDEELRIELNLRITHDLLMELLSFSGEMKVVKPARLKKKLTAMLVEAIQKNSTV